MDERLILEPTQHEPCHFSARGDAANALVPVPRHQGPSIGCLTHEPRHLVFVRSWLTRNLPNARSMALGYAVAALPREQADSILGRCDVLVLDRPTPEACAALGPMLEGPHAPELVLVGASSDAVAALRQCGSVLPIEVCYPWATPRVGAALEQALLVRWPLRRLVQEAVGRISVTDALSVLRFHMLRGALRRGRSARRAASLLGIARSDVRRMLWQLLQVQSPSRSR